ALGWSRGFQPPLGSEYFHEDQDASALGAPRDTKGFFHLLRLSCCMGCTRTGPQQLAGPVEQRTVARTEQSVISHFDESVGQDRQKKLTDKPFSSYCREFELSRGRVFVLERNFALLQAEDAVIAEANSQDVRSKVSEGCLATADGLTVHDPVFVPYLFV